MHASMQCWRSRLSLPSLPAIQKLFFQKIRLFRVYLLAPFSPIPTCSPSVSPSSVWHVGTTCASSMRGQLYLRFTIHNAQGRFARARGRCGAVCRIACASCCVRHSLSSQYRTLRAFAAKRSTKGLHNISAIQQNRLG